MTYIDCPVPINNLGLSKIVDFGQVQPLWREKKQNKMTKTNETFSGKG